MRGANFTIVADLADLREVRGLTDGSGADAVFDIAGVEKALDRAIGACCVYGTIINDCGVGEEKRGSGQRDDASRGKVTWLSTV
ncbi:hypothetical protein BDW66DRAFT_144441 [Aspergillus desertorum]